MTDLVRRLDGTWYQPLPATHCPEGHPLAPGKFTRCYDHGRDTVRCNLPGHPDEASRWVGRDPRPIRRD